MKLMMTIFTLGIALFAAVESFAMEAQSAKVVLFKRGELIAGEEFIAANESIVDYLATLPRPSGGMKHIPYNCSVKSRLIRPSLIGTSTGGYVEVRMVYELKDCTPINDEE